MTQACCVLFVLSGALASALVPVRPDILGKKATPAAPQLRVIGVYEGAYPPGIRHRAGFHPPGAVKVQVDEVKAPIILVLTAYEPVIWSINAPKGAVVRVIASGYHKQAVVGLDASVPVTLISHDGGNRDYFYAYRKEARPTESDHEREETRRKYERLAERVRTLTHMEVKDFQGNYAGALFELR